MPDLPNFYIYYLCTMKMMIIEIQLYISSGKLFEHLIDRIKSKQSPDKNHQKSLPTQGLFINYITPLGERGG